MDTLSVSDLSMEALFELVESETSHNVPNNSTTSLPFKDTLLRLFETHILPTHNICHLQYLIFFVAGSLQGFARLLIHFLSKIAYFKKCFFKARIGRRARSSFCGIGPFLTITPRPAFSDSPPSPISLGRKIIPHLSFFFVSWTLFLELELQSGAPSLDLPVEKPVRWIRKDLLIPYLDSFATSKSFGSRSESDHCYFGHICKL